MSLSGLSGLSGLAMTAGWALVSVDVRIGASSDDGNWHEGNQTFEPTSTSFYCGGYNANAYQQANSFARFDNALIPQGAQIVAAYMAVKAKENGAATVVNCRLSAIAADDPAAPTDYASAEGATRTTAYVDWNNLPAWTMGTAYQTPDFSAVIQEVIDRPGWQSGNAIVIYSEDNGSSTSVTTTRKAYSWNGVPADAPLLHIEYLAA
jgi:type IV pilus assembly protein PilY1